MSGITMLVCYPAHSGRGLEEVQLLVVDAEAEHAAAEARGVAEVPQPQRGLAHVPRQPAQVERPRHAEPVPGAVIQNTPGVVMYVTPTEIKILHTWTRRRLPAW